MATITTDKEGKITAVDVKIAAPPNDLLYLVFVVLAGLSWGVYVPLIAQGGKALKSSYASFLCVGAAYFLIAILFPLGMFAMQGFPTLNVTGSTLATLAGVAGAVGALCVIFATFEFKGPRIYVAPVIFALAPVINTVVSLFWHPTIDALATFGPPQERRTGCCVGIVLAGLGAGLVLFAKELGEAKHAAHLTRRPSTASPSPGGGGRRRSSRDSRGGRGTAQHRAGPRLDGAYVPQARRRDPGRRGATRRAAHHLRLSAPSSRPSSGAISRTICIASRGNCRSCAASPSCSPRNIAACRITPISRWPPRR